MNRFLIANIGNTRAGKIYTSTYIRIKYFTQSPIPIVCSTAALDLKSRYQVSSSLVATILCIINNNLKLP